MGGKTSHPVAAALEINGQNITMKGATGAAISLTADSTRQKLFPEAVLEPFQVCTVEHLFSRGAQSGWRCAGAGQVHMTVILATICCIW